MLQLLLLGLQQCKYHLYSVICYSRTVNSLDLDDYLKSCTIRSMVNRIIAMLEKTGTLKIASVGDCGLKIIRKGEIE
jgi:hypothetical protein